ncbi:MAG TPA: stage III sporulation protein AG [Bacillus bacterium]|uniref:Stage III sporulation protein AG n=1 Tax=Siminovitchia fordii TaxID=254759 RepID=A0ABQ4K2G7_9BACI|nr:stage III sporulation protein AG [Siminovitchia fordii]GIN19959.1 stage III sporulation protein AG [Siminovitchia fordii]HBZ08980.1 stage III sporulation protein AG [Bacillus sp. (in: firmicutes)]
MSKKNGPLDWLKNLWTDGNKGAPSQKKNNKIYYVLILVLVGAALMIISDLWKAGEEKDSITAMNEMEAGADDAEAFGSKQDSSKNGMKELENQYENQLKEALEQIVGVHDVTVVVNVEATEKTVLEKNLTLKNQTTVEEDKEGGTRKIEDQSTEDQLVLIKEGDKEVPIVLETRKPEVKGVLVVAGGAENIQIKKWIVEAVTRGLEVPSHKVAVMPKKSKGDS